MRRLLRRVIFGKSGAAAPPPPVYSPSLDFSDARNSMYSGCLN